MQNVKEKNNTVLQEPGKDIKPKVSIDMVPQLLWRLYGFRATDLKEFPSYDDLNFFFKVSYYENKFVKEIDDNGYVFKVTNAMQSKEPGFMDAQHAVVKYVRERGIPAQTPVMNLNHEEWSFEKIYNSESESTLHIVKVLNFIPGTIFCNVPYVPGSFYNVGEFLGRLHTALKGFHHEFYDTYDLLWNLTNVPKLRHFLEAVNEKENRSVVEEVIDVFSKDVLPKLSSFRKGMIHMDVSDNNLVMREVKGQQTVPSRDRVHDVAGLLDFMHTSYSYRVFDVAISICYLSIQCKDDEFQMNIGGHMLAGYLKEAELSEAEISILRLCVCARLCQSLVMGANNFMLHPDNIYALSTSYRGWPFLHRLWSISTDELMSKWEQIQKMYEKSF